MKNKPGTPKTTSKIKKNKTVISPEISIYQLKSTESF